MSENRPCPAGKHNWRYTGTDYHGSRKDEDAYACANAGCKARAYADEIKATRPTAPAPVEYGRVHTDGSRSGGQPIGTNAPVEAGEVEQLLWHVEQICGPLSMQSSVTPCDADRSILQYNFDAIISAAITAAEQRGAESERGFQSEVDRWMDVCFGDAIKADLLERADRFTEEALELAQTMPSFNAERAHALVDYVFNRPVGDRQQEVGGVMVTLAALCNPVGISIPEAASTELARIWTKVEQIRAKQAIKPVGSALPIAIETGAHDG